jgi:hypothetical protein
VTATAPPITDTAILRQVVLNAAEGETNPYKVAREILDEMTTVEELRVVAEACFPQWVREQLKRPHAPRNGEAAPVADSDKPAAAEPKTEVAAAPLMAESVRTFTGSDGIPRASRRLNQFIDTYTNALNSLVKVDDTHDGKRLRDCTVADLKWMVEYRRKVAEQSNVAADRFERLMQAMDKVGAATVAELDRAVGAPILLD